MLGQPLDLAVDVRLDSADDSGNACFEADVFHGDGQVASSRVRVIVVAGAQGQDAVVRIRSSAVVDEPVVGVVLRSICGQKASRRYDFLTDFPVETRAAAVPTIIPAVVAAPVSDASVPTPAPAPVAAPRALPERAANPVPVVRKPRPVPVSKPIVASAPKPAVEPTKEPVAAPKPVPAKAEVPDNKPRLKLESAETPDERVVQLKPASDVLLAPTDDPQKREAAAAAWRELNNLPADNAPEKQRLLALEAESKTLKALLAKNDADFQLRLEKLENNRYGESFVYTLLGLLLAALAAAAFFWNRARQRITQAATDWSHHGEPSAEEMGAVPSLSRPAPLAAQLPPNTLPGPDHDAGVDESLFDDLKKLTAVTMPAKPIVPAPRSAVTAVPARSVYPEDFLDIQQHADFFVSLGQYDQAIDVLKKSIHDSADTSPLAHLDLLKIYHTLGRQPEFQQQRAAFNRIFNSQIPEFSAFTQEGQTLEAYPASLRSIESQWGTPKVLDTIEASLFRDTASQPFDLAAYRELLLLYAMAQGTVRQSDGSLHDSLSQARSGRVSRRQDLELDVTKPEPSDDSAPRETSFTQPMLLMSEMVPLEAQDTHPEPLAPSHRPPLDLDLDLNLDFSNSELMAMEALPAAPATEVPSAPAPLDLDLDLGLDLELAPSLPTPLAASTPLPSLPPLPAAVPPVPSIDSNMLEFDLFDPKVEAKISPKPKG